MVVRYPKQMQTLKRQSTPVSGTLHRNQTDTIECALEGPRQHEIVYNILLHHALSNEERSKKGPSER